ncbi:glycosyltransferase family 2 protein [Flavobacterium degerlachei]|jgi:glycosyltransferase involved in cell wall biosynthesis|uniref:Glycosyltransferase involved in cell wall bisynthesis n=1 Tax=Flavobacterium degerlachei TaxID=229203 RepID=A0A1H2VR94_9FLAO|nr:glycosyltransferase family 2 protein [Flavobacterium degerlachei]SDW70767.1 Glycosyltransferase involved in cell wall bisynthesis [Flavobacterium degerlachei]
MKISVVIPMYNSRNTILNTLNSVKNQTILPFEVVIIDDGSKDESVTVVEDFISVNSALNIQLVKQKNRGVSSARNVGLKLAKGDWIALLDSDDEWLPTKLERQIQVLNENPTIDFLGTNRNGEYFDKILWKKLGVLTRISPKLLMVKFIFVVPTVIFRKKIVLDAGYFDETQKYAEEGNYFIRIAQKYNCYLLNESLVVTGDGKAHFGHSGLSGNLKEMERGELKNLKDALSLKIINHFQYSFLVLFSILKYFRRIVIVKTRQE